MKRRSCFGVVFLFSAVAVCLTAAPGTAQLTNEATIGVGIDPNSVEMQLAPPDARYVLSIAGPNGFSFQQEFARGDAPTLSAHSADGGVLANGAYTYELRLIPEITPEIETAIKMARETGDMSEIEELKAEGAIPRFAVITSGNFTVEAGTILNRAERELTADPEDTLSANDIPISAADICYYDDLIVDGSLCVGFDCTCNMSFGFDTIVLKENNLRIFFDDTSTAASFPRNDWRIVANDSANGGASYLGVEDSTGGRRVFTLEAGAPSHSLFVDDGGRVGMGTSTPSVEIHTVDGDTPTLRLQQDGSSGFAPQTWDVAGNETNFFVRDVTSGSTLPFRIRPGAPTSSIDIAADGDVGIGTSSPDYDLDIDNGTSSAANFVVRGQSGSMILQDQDGGGGAAQHLVNAGFWRLRGLDASLSGQTAVGMTLDLTDSDVGINCNSAADHDLVIASGAACTGTPRSWIDAGSTSFSTSSSRFFKENLTAINVAGILNKIGQVAVYSYDFVDGPQDRIGLVAEEFHQIFGRGSDQELSGHEVQLALWMAVQQLNERIIELEALLLEKNQ
ncbi:MAG: tail fiber domain-containing protein [bacterium]|nr:tail fiber domain-containing protein [bacterium]